MFFKNKIMFLDSPYTSGKHINILSLRFLSKSHSQVSAGDKSLLFTVEPQPFNKSDLKWVGWERNNRGKFGPRFVDVSSDMDPKK